MTPRGPLPEEALNRSAILEREGKDYFHQASENTANELARRTFRALAERHAQHAEEIEEAYRRVLGKQVPQVETTPAPPTMFDEIMRTIEQSTAPTAADIAELRQAIVYSTKVRDVYIHLAETADTEWERAFYGNLRREETALKLTLSDTLNYLRSNFELSDLPEKE